MLLVPVRPVVDSRINHLDDLSPLPCAPCICQGPSLPTRGSQSERHYPVAALEEVVLEEVVAPQVLVPLAHHSLSTAAMHALARPLGPPLPLAARCAAPWLCFFYVVGSPGFFSVGIVCKPLFWPTLRGAPCVCSVCLSQGLQRTMQSYSAKISPTAIARST